MTKTAILKINNNKEVIRQIGVSVCAIPDKINRKSVFWILAILLVALSSGYLYFITQTIINTASFEKTEKEIAMLDSTLGELEAESIALKRQVDFALAEELGYQEVANVRFVDSDIINQTLSLVKSN